MPELPEVETIRIGLEKYLVGKTIEAIDIRTPSIFHGDPKLITGADVITVKRRGKGLLIELSNDYTIAAHVKMTGQFIYKETPLRSDVAKAMSDKQGFTGQAEVAKGTDETKAKNFHPKLATPIELPHKHTHVVFTLRTKNQERRTYLYYNDIRKFGWLQVVRTEDALSLPFFKALGREPLSNLTMKHFSNIVHTSKAPIKSVLMDQSKIAGVGNIYANEALFGAKIAPTRKAQSLTKKEAEALYEAMLAVLTKGLAFGGASDNTYLNVDGGQGTFQQHFQVYGKQDEQCPVCATMIKRIVIGGRGTFFCPTCQR